MNKLGIHSLIWVTDWSEASSRHAIDQSARSGFDLVEVVIFDPDTIDADRTARLAREAGICVEAGMALNPDADVSSPDRDVARRGETLVEQAILRARDMGATALGGVTHSAMHRYPAAALPDALKRVTEVYGRLAAKARQAGIRLGIEAVNRYESNMVNTLGQGAEIVRRVGEPALFVHFDTYHANIEETDVAAAIARDCDVIGYVHIGESNRGYLGSGNVDFPKYFNALAKANYGGAFTVEAFSTAILNSSVANVLATWRQSWNDPADLAGKALAFLKTHRDAAFRAETVEGR